MKHALAVLLLGASLAGAAPPTITVPNAVAGDVGDFISVPATTEGQTVKWISVEKGLNLFPTDLLKSTRTAVVIGKVPGIFHVIAYTSNADGPSDPAICTITVGTPVPPTPPTPPGPNPSDPLAQALALAYAAEASPTKAADVAKLASLYQIAATAVVNDSATWQDLISETHAAITALFSASSNPDTVLQGLRQVIAKDLQALGGQPSNPLDKTKAAAEYLKIGTILETMKGK